MSAPASRRVVRHNFIDKRPTPRPQPKATVRYVKDQYGRVEAVPAGMLAPVRCTYCRTLYDLGAVEVIAQHADCTVYKAPCCGRTVDDRLWTGFPAIAKLEPADRADIRLAASRRFHGGN